MKILNNLNLVKSSLGHYLFLDNNSLIAIVNFPDLFKEILKELIDKNYYLTTIPSVIFEFTRADNVETYNKRANFLKNNDIGIFPIERFLDNLRPLVPVVHRINKDLEYPDFLLYCCLLQFRQSQLLTENHKHFTTSILDRVGLLTLDTDTNQIRNIGLYKLSEEKFESAAESILHTSHSS